MLAKFTAKLLYNVIGYPLLFAGAHAAALFSRKLRIGISGRRRVVRHALQFRHSQPNARLVLFHCASAGELEGVKPLAAACRQQGYLPCVSYFSPSAETSLKPGEFEFADYSPFDSARAVSRFLGALRPEVILISKHDVWPNLVWQAKRLKIPIWLINGNFHAASTKSIPGVIQFHRCVYSDLTGILTVSDDDAKRARRFAGERETVLAVGDSRFDRVLARAKNSKSPYPEFEKELLARTFLVAGSTHDADVGLLVSALGGMRDKCPNLQLIIVPHDPSDDEFQRIKGHAERSGFDCKEIGTDSLGADIIVMNRSGILADIYRYGKLAYVGGGFDRGVHSVLEPMAHGLRVITGPRIEVSREANEALEEGILRVVFDAAGLEQAFADFYSTHVDTNPKEFVRQRSGVVDRVMKLVLPQNAIA